MPKVKVGDINIYYEVHGEGEPLVLANGAGVSVASSSMMFAPVFSQEFKFIMFDARGVGESDAPDIPYTTEMMAEDLSGLLETIGIDSTHLMGWSLGGMIAQHFAARYPEKVKSLILVSTYPGGVKGVPMTAASKELVDLDIIQKSSPEEIAEKTIRIGLTAEFRENNPDFVKQFYDRMLANPLIDRTTTRQGQAAAQNDSYAILPDIKAPTLIIHGDGDASLPVENARIMASRIPNAELVILKNTGHMLLEAGDETNRIMLDFLRRHSATIQG